MPQKQLQARLQLVSQSRESLHPPAGSLKVANTQYWTSGDMRIFTDCSSLAWPLGGTLAISAEAVKTSLCQPSKTTARDILKTGRHTLASAWTGRGRQGS